MKHDIYLEIDLTPSEATLAEWKAELGKEDHPPLAAWLESDTRNNPETKNDVKSEKFQSKMDDFFTSKTKVKDSGRKCSIKIFGQWT